LENLAYCSLSLIPYIVDKILKERKWKIRSGCNVLRQRAFFSELEFKELATDTNMLERLNRALFSDGGGEEDAESGVPLAQVAWQRLRADIICGRIRPKVRLRIGKLRENYGIGATPLREALSRLVSDGFVVALDRRGFMVAPVSLREYRELTDLRKLLEKEAARLSLKNGDDVWESHVVAALHRVTKLQSSPASKMSPVMKEWETLNELFLETMMAGCESVWLLNFRRAAYFYAKRYHRVCLAAATIRGIQKDHRALADAALARDVTKLQNLIEDQLERTYKAIEASGKV
jgi:GntR family transcriptional regulator, carbon starvation induced regulator